MASEALGADRTLSQLSERLKRSADIERAKAEGLSDAEGAADAEALEKGSAEAEIWDAVTEEMRKMALAASGFELFAMCLEVDPSRDPGCLRALFDAWRGGEEDCDDLALDAWNWIQANYRPIPDSRRYEMAELSGAREQAEQRANVYRWAGEEVTARAEALERAAMRAESTASIVGKYRQELARLADALDALDAPRA